MDTTTEAEPERAAPLIRPEQPDDHEAIRHVVAAAFQDDREADLVEAIRAPEEYIPALALVAVLDGEVVGHVMVSHTALDDGSVRHRIHRPPRLGATASLPDPIAGGPTRDLGPRRLPTGLQGGHRPVTCAPLALSRQSCRLRVERQAVLMLTRTHLASCRFSVHDQTCTIWYVQTYRLVRLLWERTEESGMETIEVSPRVARAAEEHRLGSLVTNAKGSNPLSNAALALVVTLLLGGAMVLVGSLGWSLLRWTVIVLLAMTLMGAYYTVVTLLAGFRRFYLFTGGIVRWANGRITAFAWSETTDVQRTRFRSTQTGFQFTLVGGKTIYVEAVCSTDDGAEFAAEVERRFTEAGISAWG